MIDDLLDISRINQGKIQLKQEPLHVGPVIARAVEAVSHLIEEKKHELNVSVATGAMRVKADPTRLEQVVTNLLTNAAKYTDPGGSISVTAAPEKGAVVIKVKDNGIGLTREMLERGLRALRSGRKVARPGAGRAGNRPCGGQETGRDARRERRGIERGPRSREANSRSGCLH